MEEKAIFTPISNGSKNLAPQIRIEDEAEKEHQILAANKRKEIQFRAFHTLLIGFFLWILYVPHPKACEAPS